MTLKGPSKGQNIRFLVVPGWSSQTKANQRPDFFYAYLLYIYCFCSAHCLTKFRPHFWDDFMFKDLVWSNQNISILQGDTIGEHHWELEVLFLSCIYWHENQEPSGSWSMDRQPFPISRLCHFIYRTSYPRWDNKDVTKTANLSSNQTPDVPLKTLWDSCFGARRRSLRLSTSVGGGGT